MPSLQQHYIMHVDRLVRSFSLQLPIVRLENQMLERIPFGIAQATHGQFADGGSFRSHSVRRHPS